MHFNTEVKPTAEEVKEVRIFSERTRREMSLKERGKLCKDLKISQKSFDVVSNVLGDINSIPVIGKIAGTLTAGVSIATHLAEGGLDIAQTALDCADVPFDELKEFMQKQINEVNRKLDSNSAALAEVARMVSKTLSAVQESREEMNRRFDEVLESIESTKIEPIVSNINNFVRYFESEKERIRGLKEHEYVSKLEEEHGILPFFRESRTPMCDNSLNNALFDIIKQRYAVPDSEDDELSFKALYALLYGTEAHVSVMSFLIEQYSYLASYHYKRGEIDQYNECFDSISNIFLEFKSSLVGTGMGKGEPLLQHVIQTLTDIRKIDFMVLHRPDIIQMLNNKIDIFKKIKNDIRDMEPSITTNTPSNYAHISFGNEIGVPILEWEKNKKVQYAVQYKNKTSFSRVGEWSEDITINNYACPILRMGNDPSRNTVLIFRKFQGSKPQLVGSVEPYQQEFTDIHRDLYNAAEYPEKKTGFETGKILLEKKANFTTTFEKDRTVLHAAAKSGNADIAFAVLLKSNPKGSSVNPKDINVVDEDGYTPMHIAADSGNAGFVKFLINLGGLVNVKTKRGLLTPLHLAARRGFLKTFNRLLESPGTQINERNEEGFTPLHYAVLGGKFIVRSFIQNIKTEINPKSTKKELTPFHMAVINNDLSVVQTLIESQNVEINAGDKNNMTPLHYSAMLGHREMVDYLLTLNGIKLNLVTNDNKWSPLHYAIYFKYDDIALKLLNSPNINDSLKADGESTPLHFAVLFERKNVLSELLTRNVNLEAKTKEGYTPLHLAAMRENPEIVTVLLNSGANIDAKTVNESTPLHLATFTGRANTALTLLDRGANLKVSDKDDQTPLHGAAKSGQLQVIQKLLTRDPSVIDLKNKNLDTPLNLAAQNFHTATAKYLIDKRADINTRNSNGTSPLIVFTKFGSLNMVKYAIDHGADVYIADNNGINFIYQAIRNGHLTIVRYASMLKEKIQWNKVDESRKKECSELKEETPIICSIEFFAVCDSVRYGKLEIVKYFVGELNKNVCKPLSVAALFGRLDIVKYLVEEKGMNVNPYKGYYNDLTTPLCNAAKGGHLEVAQYLVYRKADMHTNCGFNHAIDLAIRYDHPDIVKFLVESGADLRYKNRLGHAPVRSAIHYEKFEILKYFIEEKTERIDINERDPILFNTPLISAVYVGRLDVVKSLVEHGADLTLENYAGETALQAAKNLQQFETVEYLQSKSRRFTQRTMDNNAPYINYPSNMKLNKETKFESSKYISGEEDIMKLKKSNVDIRNVDVIGTLMLLDVIVRYFTNQKYIGERNGSVSDAETRATALEITGKFEELISFFQNFPEERIDFSEVHNNIYKAIKNGKENQVQQILCSAMKSLSVVTVEEIDELLSELLSNHPHENSFLSIEEAAETYELVTHHCLGTED